MYAISYHSLVKMAGRLCYPRLPVPVLEGTGRQPAVVGKEQPVEQHRA